MNTFGFRMFDYDVETFLLPGQFCRAQVWTCRGHLDSEIGEARGEVRQGGSSGSGGHQGLRSTSPQPPLPGQSEVEKDGVSSRGADDPGLNVPGRPGGAVTGADPLVLPPAGPEYSVEETLEMLRWADAEAAGSGGCEKPRLPGILAAGLPVQEQGVSDDTEGLLRYPEATHERSLSWPRATLERMNNPVNRAWADLTRMRCRRTS